MPIRRIEIVERQPTALAPEQLTSLEAQAIRASVGEKLQITGPNDWGQSCWRLLSEGWVGQLPVTADLVLVLNPKVPVANLFRMIEVAYNLKSLEFPPLPTVVGGELSELFDRIARVLVLRTLQRIRRGLHRDYLRYEEALPFVRGALDLQDLVRKGPSPAVSCRYEEQTADIDDNRILLWTLRRITSAGVAREETSELLRKASRSMAGEVGLSPFRGSDCRRRSYNRLNSDYEPLHGLCRFFLDSLGPAHESGAAAMVPFLVNMDKLFEQFVAEWLRSNLPPELALRDQERLTVDDAGNLKVVADLVLLDSETGRPLAVLDTKYKRSGLPDPSDVAQINMYADLLDVQQAILVYPAPSPAFRVSLRETHVHTLGFDLSSNLESSGRLFLRSLLMCAGRLSRANRFGRVEVQGSETPERSQS